VNDELGALTEFIEKSIALLVPGGRLAIITFHSIEDRIVKHTFKAHVEKGEGINPIKKPLTPTDAELQENPRARSAKLRIFEKT
jgi:16S rRNA (cytosine1402-N4)-methyltransferase